LHILILFRRTCVATIKTLSIASVGAVLMTWGIGESVSAGPLNPPPPPFETAANYTTTIEANNNSADIYYPNLQALQTTKTSLPIALLLQGANVDKSDYSIFASHVARYGFIVVVPNQPKSLPEVGFNGLLPDTSQINAVLAQMKTENTNPSSPIVGVVNTKKLALLGHSAGGAVGLSAIANLCIPILCDGSFSRPPELIAGAFFGANLRDQVTGEFIPINNSGIPTALLQGTLDGIALPERATATYDQIQNPPKALVSMTGLNHYGMTNTNNPLGPLPDPNTPTLAQDSAVETVARWSGLFLRANVLNDRRALAYVYLSGDKLDQNVEVTSQGCLNQFLPKSWSYVPSIVPQPPELSECIPLTLAPGSGR
jgi:Chlorophyllase